MNINLIFKIAAVGILVSILSQVLKHSGRDEQAFLTSLAGLILVLCGCFHIFTICFSRSGSCSCCERGENEYVAGGSDRSTGSPFCSAV